MSEQIQPGTPVRVVVHGIVRRSSPITVDSSGGGMFMGISDDPYVTVTPLGPERPTLDRETLALAVRNADHAWTMGSGLKTHETWTGYLSDAILDLIQAAHPEWTT